MERTRWHRIQRRSGDVTPGYEFSSPSYDRNSFREQESVYWTSKVPRVGYDDILRVCEWEFGGKCEVGGKLRTAVFRRRVDASYWDTSYMTDTTIPGGFYKG